MATDVNHTVPSNQPVFQMLNDDAYSDEGTEFYESKNSFESAQEHLIDIFEPRMTSKVAMNKPISNNSQDRFQPIQNDEIKSVDKEEKTVDIPPTLDETINELDAQKRESGKDQSIVNDEEEEEEEPKVEESLKDNVSDISENLQSSQSSIAHSDKTNPTAATQSNQSQKSSLNLLDMTSSSSLNQKTSLSGSLHENRSTPALSSDGESIKNDKIEDQEDISEDEEDHKEFQVKDFTENNEEFTQSTNNVFSPKMSNKSESIQLSESQQIHEEITMEPAKPKSKTLRFKHVRTFYNRCIQKYHSAKSWVNVAFTRRPKYDQQIEPKSKSAENVATVRLESFEDQRVSHSVENFSQYTASISVVEEETSSPFPGFFTPIYYNQRKTESIMSGNKSQNLSNDACSAVFNIRELCEERFYYNPQ